MKFGILILCLFTRIYVVLDSVIPEDNLALLNFIVFYNGKIIWGKNIYAICLFFQAPVLLFKVLRLNKRMVENRWSLSNHSSRFFITCMATLAWTIVIALFNDEYWNDVTKFIYITVYVGLIYHLMYMVANGYDLRPVIDENNETQYLEEKPKYSEMAAEFERLLNDEQIFLNGHLSIEDVAQMLHSNRTYVSRMVKETYGDNFTTKINRHRLAHAKRYMEENPGIKLDAVAAESGFGSTSAFCKVFKDSEGVTPSQWQKK